MSHDPPGTPRRTPNRRTLERLARSALTVDGVDHAAVGVVRKGSVVALGATDHPALVLAEEQVHSGVGPLVEALETQRPVEVPALTSAEVPPALAVLAGAHGVVAAAAHPVVAGSEVVGVVATCGVRPLVPGPAIGPVVARAASVLAPGGHPDSRRTTVELAAEVVGRHWGISFPEALVLLRACARSTGVPLEDVAASLLDGTLALDTTRG